MEILPELKYNLKKYLDSIPSDDYHGTIIRLAEMLGVDRTTVYQWRNIALFSEREIPEGKMELLAQFFKVSAEQLRNYTPIYKNN